MNDTFEDQEPVDRVTGEVLSPFEKGPAPEVPGKNLDEALAKVMAELPIWITQDANLPITANVTRKYASLKAIMGVVRPILTKHGVRIRQGCDHAWQLDTGSAKGRCVPVFTELKHTASGQNERTTVEIPMTRMDAQAMGSAISYGRRYSLLAALGLTTDEAEDDGLKTKGRDITDDNEESQELWVIRAEISECPTNEALSKWLDKAKASGKFEKLSDQDMALARVAFKDRRKAINDAQDAPEGKKK